MIKADVAMAVELALLALTESGMGTGEVLSLFSL